MLVEDKFIFVCLPRCASTSFEIACMRNNFTIKRIDENWDKIITNKYNEFKEYDDDTIADNMVHIHTQLNALLNKFGNGYPIISIKRNPYERFISLYKHLIDECTRIGDIEFANMLRNQTVDEVFNVDNKKLLDMEYLDNLVEKIIKKHKDKIQSPGQYIKNMLKILYQPYSYWHDNNENIIWFDFNKLYELEEWVSNITNKKFKMEKGNSSNNFECKLNIQDDNFISKYNFVFSKYDHQKKEKTLV